MKLLRATSLLAALFLAYLRMPDFVGGDPSQWTEVAVQMNFGRGIYSEVYDNKDLGFFLALQFLATVFGRFALLVLWVLTWILLAAALNRIMRNLIVNTMERAPLISVAVLTLMLTPAGASDAITNTLPAVLAIHCYLNLKEQKRERLSILFLLFLPLLKFFFIAPAIIILAAYLREKNRTFTITATIGLLSLLALENFRLWLDVIWENLLYSRTSLEVIRGSESRLTLFTETLASDLRACLLLALWLLTLIGYSLIRRSAKSQVVTEPRNFIVIASINVVHFLILALSFTWIHHLAILVLPILVNLAGSLEALPRFAARTVQATELLVAAAIFIFTIVSSWNVFQSINKGSEISDTRLSKEIFTLDALPDSWRAAIPREATYAYLGRSEISLFPSLVLPNETRLSCPDTFLFSFFEARGQKQVACAGESNIIFITNETLAKLPSSPFRQATALLERDYNQITETWGDWLMFVRNAP